MKVTYEYKYDDEIQNEVEHDYKVEYDTNADNKEYEDDYSIEYDNIDDNKEDEENIESSRSQVDGNEVSGRVCPGGDLETCIDVCPGEFGAAVFGFCVVSCSHRCP